MPNIAIDPAIDDWDVPIPAVEKPKFKIFWGGRDVDPALYNRPKSKQVGLTLGRHDRQEMNQMLECIKDGIPVIGICRGAQLLNVANGGILIQHIEEHTKSHYINLIGRNNDVHSVWVTSTHHQAMIPTVDAEILGRSFEKVDGVHWDNVDDAYEYPHVNEVVYYPKTKSLCIQPHPEWMDQDKSFIKIINEIIQDKFGFDFTIDFKKEAGVF